MQHIKHTCFSALANLKDKLVDVGATLDQSSDDALPEHVPQMDLTLRTCWEKAEQCRRLLLMHRQPKYAAYDPVEVLRRHSGETRLQLPEGISMPARQCVGDGEQVLECIRLLRDNVQIERNSGVRTEIVTDVEEPRVVLTLTGGGSMPTSLRLNDLYTFEIDEFGRRWTAATNGGHVAMAEVAVLFYFQGDREVPPSLEDLQEPLDAVTRLARRLSSWRGAIGHYEPGMVSGAEICSLYRDTVSAGIAQIDTALAGYRLA